MNLPLTRKRPTLGAIRSLLAMMAIVLFGSAHAQVLFNETFTGGAPVAGFTTNVIVPGEGCDWFFNNPGFRSINGAGFDADFAIFDNDFCGNDINGDIEESQLISPAFDASVPGTYTLSFDHQYQFCCASVAGVDVWNGSSWTNVYTLPAASVGYPDPALNNVIDITTATGGSAVAQVRFTYAGDWAWWWAVDNIQVSLAAFGVCSGTPDPGATISSAAAACPSANFTLSLQNIVGTGTDYQWQFDNGGGWTNFGTNASTQVVNQTVATSYQCIVTCSAGGGTPDNATSTPIAVPMQDVCLCTTYCTVTNFGDGACISAVDINTLSSTTGACVADPGYTLRPETTTLQQGASYTLTVSTAHLNGYIGAIVSVWFDWNNNGNFEATEWYQPYTNATTGSSIVSVPVDAALGTIRMRVRSRGTGNQNDAGSGCLAMGSGTTEDFCIVIEAAPTCTGTPDAGVTESSSLVTCPNVNFTLSMSTNPFGQGMTYAWERADDAAFTTNVVALGTSSTQVTNQTVDSWYRCLVTCTEPGGGSDYSDAVQVIMGGSDVCATNNDCANAISLTVNPFGSCPGAGIPGSTVGATNSGMADPSCLIPGLVDVFYSFNSGSNTSISWQLTLGTMTARAVQVLTSCGGSEVYCIGDADNGSFAVTANTDYILRVLTLATTTGTFDICLSSPPANDQCAGALPVVCGVPIVGTTVGASAIGAPATCVTALNTAPGLWYTFSGVCGDLVASLCSGTDYDSKIGVFSGSCGALTCVTGNDDFCGVASEVAFTADPALTYYVYVTGFGTNVGNFTLSLTGCQSAAEVNSAVPADDCGNGQFSVNVDVSSFGTEASANFLVSVDGGAPTSTAAVLGNNPLGPFSASSDVSIVLDNGSLCVLDLGTFYSSCPITVTCGDLISMDHCYGNFDQRVFTFIGNDPFQTLSLTFISGTMDANDVIRAYAGTDPNGITIESGSFANLGIPQLTITSFTDTLMLVIDSDGSNSCQDGQQTTWEFEVECTPPCVDPDGTATVDPCTSTIIATLDFEGSGSTAGIRYIVNGGTPVDITGLNAGALEILGPFTPGDAVHVFLLHEDDAACNRNLGTIIIPPVPTAPNIVVTATPTEICPGGDTQLAVNVTGTSSITVVIGDNDGWLDEVSWSLTNSLSTVIASAANGTYGFDGGPYVTNIANPGPGPYTFTMEAQGTFNDNLPTYDILCNGTNSILSGSVNGGGTFTQGGLSCPLAVDGYSWVPADNLDDPSSATPYASGITEDTEFTVTVTYAGCLFQGSTSVTVVTPIAANEAEITPASPTLCSGLSVELTAAALGGLAPYTYTWTDPNAVVGSPSASPTVDATIAGEWTVVIEDACGAQATASVTVTEATQPVAAASNDGPQCSGGDLQLTGSSDQPGSSFDWTGPNGFSSTDQSPLLSNVALEASGTYTLTVTLGSCTDVATTDVVVNWTPPAPTTEDYTLCLDATVPPGEGLTATAPASSGTVSSPFPGAPFSSEGTVAATAVVNVPAIPAGATVTSATLNLTNVNSINGSWRSEIRVELLGAYALAPTQISTLTSGGLITPDPVINLAGFPAGGGAVTVSLTETFNDGGAGGGVIDATFGSITINVNWSLPASTLVWYDAPSGGNQVATGSPFDPGIDNSTPSSTTFYVANETADCSSPRVPATFTVDGSSAPVASAGSNSPVCEGSTIMLTATSDQPGSTFEWTGPNGFSSTDQNPEITDAALADAGTYSVTVTAGCFSVATTDVVVLSAPTAVTATSDYSICLNSTVPAGEGLTVSAPNATGTVSTPFPGAPFSSEGTVAATAVVNVPAIPAGATVTSATLNLTNVNSINGSWRSEIRVALSGAYALGATQISTLTSGGLITPDPVINLAGFPAGGGAVTVSLTETFNDGGANAGVIDATFGSITINVNWSMPPSFVWFDDAIGSIAVGAGSPFNPVPASVDASIPGNTIFYAANVASNGCVSALVPATFTVEEFAAPDATASNNGPLCAGEDLELTATSDQPSTFEWTGPNGFSSTDQNPVISNAGTANAGTYSVTVTANCASVVTTDVVVNPAAPAMASTGDYSICQNGSVPVGGGLTAAGANSGTVSTPFPGAPFSSEGTVAATAVVNVPAIPAGATVTSATLNLTNVNSINGSWRSEIRVALSGAYALGATQISTLQSGGLITPDPVINLAGFPAGGGAVTVSLTETFNDGGANAGVIDATFGSITINVNYTIATTYAWYDAATNGNLVGTGTPFNPVPGSVDPGVTGSTTFYAANVLGSCESSRLPAVFTVEVPDTWYADLDNDGYGDPDDILLDCVQPPGYVANASDNCPAAAGLVGDPCDDGNPSTPLSYLDENCDCIGASCTTDLRFDFTMDAASSMAWEIRESGTNILVQSGSTILGATGLQVNTCLPDGCYYVVVTDEQGDGITGGGYNLHLAGDPDVNNRIIDNTGNYGGVTPSQISGGIDDAFCIPMSSDRVIFTSCDKMDWVNNQYIVANDNPAVTAQYGGPNAGTSGYVMWWYAPNGGYSFRRFQSHNTANGLSASSTRACHFKINSWSGNQMQPNVLYNVKVRSRVAGVNSNFGSACQFMINPTLAACPQTKLIDIPGHQYYSCGVHRTLGTSPNSRVHAIPTEFVPAVATSVVRYQFRFRIPGEGFEVIRTSSSYFINLNWTGAGALQVGKTYEVDVRVSKTSGASWCIGPNNPTPLTDPNWGKVCLVTIDGSLQGGNQNIGMEQGEASGFRMFPNPNRGDQLFVALDGFSQEVSTVSVDIFDAYGKRVVTRTIPVSDKGMVSSMIELNGDLAAGVYLVNLTAGDQVRTERLVIQP